jgi:hypothetical protein
MISEEQQKDLVAQQQLGLGKDWTIVYTASAFDFLHDPADILQKWDEDENISWHEIETAIDNEMTMVEMPKGWRLVGLRQKDGDSPRKYGLVDFSSLGAA